LEAFFDERLPPQIFTVKAFGRWYESLDDEARHRLLYDRATLLRDDAETPGEEFPDRLTVDGESVKLVYRFEPGHPEDGVTAVVPLHLLNRLDTDRMEWLVPGLVEDKVRALLASLPKSKRRSFVPMADYARAALEAMPPMQGGLRTALARELTRIGGIEIEPGDFQLDKLPEHLRFNVRVLDESGRTLDAGRDLAALQDKLGEDARRMFMQRQADEWQRDGLQGFEDLELPEHVTTRTGHAAWPALVPQDGAVGLRLFDDEAEARTQHHSAVLERIERALADKLKYAAKQHRLSREAQLAWTRAGDVAGLEAALARRVLSDAIGDAWAIRDAKAFDGLATRLRQEFLTAFSKAIDTLDSVILKWHEVTRRLDEVGPAQPSAHEDMESQLADLVYDGFVADVPVERLAEYPRYLEGVDARIDALEIDPRRDVQRQTEVQPWWQRYLDHLAEHGVYTPELDRYRWLVEEYRIQVFAQQLGTAEKVSAKRLKEAWEEVE
ncbi:MAG: DUF3418 domain-containing protein, partial [Wenzhouxiangellaceae bacterium]|nr:DUF3418 domain-containing protein [Wenzhouxiangellaceae bacterium]